MNKPPDLEETNVGVHALLVTPEGQIILQKRDINPNIVNSGKISIFGGTLKANDDLLTGLKRELMEELELNIDNYSLDKLGTYIKTKELDGVNYTIHIYTVENVDPASLHLHEGAGFVINKPEELLKNPALTRITKLALEDYAKP